MATLFAAPKRKRFGIDIKMMIFASQDWKCNVCRCRLPATAELDHFIPLGCGFWHLIETQPNDIRNLQALCPNCHAEKTMGERMAIPKGSYVACRCGRTHSRYFLPKCTSWRRRFKRLAFGVSNTRRKSKRVAFKNV